jgi:hypothetical protein
MVPETCWASNKICTKNSSVASSWHFISTCCRHILSTVSQEVYCYLYLIFTWTAYIKISRTEIATVKFNTLNYTTYLCVSFKIRTACQICQTPTPTAPCIYVFRKIRRNTRDHFHKLHYIICLSAALIKRKELNFIISEMLFVLTYLYATFFGFYCNSVSPGTVPARITTPK